METLVSVVLGMGNSPCLSRTVQENHKYLSFQAFEVIS